MSKSEMLSLFLLQITEFLNDLIVIFPEDSDLLSANNMLMSLKKSNPKALIKIWYKYVVTKYENEILDGKIDFFLDRDYTEDLIDEQQNGIRVIEAIERFRQPIRLLSESNKIKSLQYIQNLTKLSSAYLGFGKFP
jgi:hypothetical protein